MNEAAALVQQAQDALSQASRALDALRRIQGSWFETTDDGQLGRVREYVDEALSEVDDLESYVDTWLEEEELEDTEIPYGGDTYEY